MKINIATFLRALPSFVPMVGEVQAVGKLIEEIIESFDDPADREMAGDALADLAADNDAGHLRYQAKLAEAARR